MLQGTWGLGCLSLALHSRGKQPWLLVGGQCVPPVLCPSSPCRQLGPWVPQLPCAPCQAGAALGEPCPQLFYIPSALVSVTVQITCYNKPTSPILQGTVVFLRLGCMLCLGEPTAMMPRVERMGAGGETSYRKKKE